MTSFMMFVKIKRHEILKEQPGLRQEMITTMCGQMWKGFDEPTKARYKELAEQYKQEKKGNLPL